MAVPPVRDHVIPYPTERVAPVGPAARATGASFESASAFEKVLRGLGREVSGGESLMRTAMTAGRSGRALDPAEIIALQAGVYRYGEAVDLASRLIDRATSSVKTVLQGQ